MFPYKTQLLLQRLDITIINDGALLHIALSAWRTLRAIVRNPEKLKRDLDYDSRKLILQ